MRILVAVDLGECSALACRWVLARVDGLGVDQLIFHHVLEADAAAGRLSTLERATRELRGFVEALPDGVPSRDGLDVAYAVTSGDPADEILEAAGRYGIDAVAMGTHGRKGFDRFFMGSVAERVVRAAPCTVIVVKPRPA